jgi:hypothetical protein
MLNVKICLNATNLLINSKKFKIYLHQSKSIKSIKSIKLIKINYINKINQKIDHQMSGFLGSQHPYTNRIIV